MLGIRLPWRRTNERASEKAARSGRVKAVRLRIVRPTRARRFFVVLGRNKIATVAVAVAVLAIFAAVSHPRIVGAAATTRELPVYSVERDNKAISLTFDAAWGNEDTEELIEILGTYNVRATFFVVGAWAEKFPESVKSLADAGHEVMTHSNNHEHFTRLSANEIIANINASNEKIARVTGKTPTLFRAPYGEYDDKVISTIKSMGITTVQWDVDSLDWKEISAAEITKRVTGKAAAGSIVLFHNAAKHTPEALTAIIEHLIKDGFSIVPVSELLLTGEYTIDHTGRQIAK